MNEGSNEIIKAIMYVIDQTMYINSKQLYSRPIYQELEEDLFYELNQVDFEELTSINYKDIDFIAKKLSEHLSASLNKKYFEKEKATIKVDGKNVKVTKVIYPLNNDSVFDLVTEILDKVKADNKLIEVFAKSMGVEASDFKEMLDQITINKEDINVSETQLFLYTTGFFDKVIGAGLSVGEDIISYASLGKVSEFLLESDGFKIVAIIKNGRIEGTITEQDAKLVEFKVRVDEKDDTSKIDLEVSVNSDGVMLTFNLTGEGKEINENKVDSSFDAKIAITMDGETQEVEAKVKMSVETGDVKVADFDGKNAINYDKLTTRQQDQIMTNFEEAIEGTFLYDIMFPEYDFEEDYYYYYSDI